MHGCYTCHELFRETEWSGQCLRHHRCKGVPLVCKACSENGFSARHVQKIICSQCERTMGHRKFDSNDLKHANARDTLASLICVDCKNGSICGGCRKTFPKSYWKVDERKKCAMEGRVLICKACRAQGKHPQDVGLYKCNRCSLEMGCSKFSNDALQNWKRREGSKLQCSKCEAAIGERLKILKQRLSKSKMVCNCFCPIHKEKCPLSLHYAGEKRWPGGNFSRWHSHEEHISWFDRAFLQSLKPVPRWWARAWGRRE